MMNKFNWKQFLVWSAILFTIGFSSCDSDDEMVPEIEALKKYETGVLISNEGPFQSGSGSISFYDRSTGMVENNVFETANNRVLGNIVQSVTVYEELIYIVVNNGNKIEIASTEDFSSVGVIENLVLPRYFLGINENKAYVSQWGSSNTGSIEVIDLTTHTISKSIATGVGTDRMVLMGNKVYAINSGGFGIGTSVSVIDINSDTVIETITVSDNPNSIQIGNNNDIWVLCGGAWKADYTGLLSSGALVKIDAITDQVTDVVTFNDFTSQPSSLIINKSANEIYYSLADNILAFSTSNINTEPEIVTKGFFYGLGFSEKEGFIYASDAGDYSSAGKIMVFDINGSKQNEFSVGVVPNGSFYFSEED